MELFVSEKIMHIESANEAWYILDKTYKGYKTKKVKLLTLSIEFDLLQNKNNKTIEEYFSRTQKSVNQMKAN